MSVSKIHHCISQELVSQGLEEPPAAKCRCRKYIGLTEATKMVKNGEARWTVTKRTQEVGEQTCSLCHADPEFDHCANCGGRGKVTVMETIEDYGDDIVLVSRAAVDKTEKKYRPALALKTPRVATIESEHVTRAFVRDDIREIVEMVENGGRISHKYINDKTSPQMAQAARERIEEYGRLIIEARAFIGPNKCCHAPEKICSRCGIEGLISAIKNEPEDNAKLSIGRKYDWGRSL
jgi:hypothetical protein